MATLLLISALLSTGLSQVVPTAGSDTFPSCAVSCPALQSAQGACVPPAVAASDQVTYTSCFCKNAALQAFKNSINGVCDSVCTAPADLTELQQWYLGTCNSQAQQTSTTSTGTTAEKTDAAGAVTTSAPSEATSGGTSQGWFSTHWRWVVMIIVLAVGFAVFAALLVYFKRRHQRKHTAQYAAAHSTAAAAMSSSRLRVNRLSTATPSGSLHPSPSPRPGGVLVSQALGDEEWGSPQARAHTRGWDFVDAGPPGRMRDGPSPVPSARLGKARR